MSWTEWTDSSFRGLNLKELKVDQAFLNVSNAKAKKFYLYSLSEECVKCPFKRLSEIAPNQETIIKLNVARNLELRLYEEQMGKYVIGNETKVQSRWSALPELGEFGIYDLKIMESDAIKFQTAKEPVNVQTSLALVAIILVAFYWLCKGVNKFYLSRLSQEAATDTEQQEQQTADDELDSAPRAKKRLKSLDIFRGIAIVLMIFVNSGGGHYWWIEHATWNGLHFADLVFPWFLFIMGCCIPMSIKSQINRQTPMAEIVGKIIQRSITLFILGLFLNTAFGATFQNIRLFGVLQRFGVAYGVVSLLHLAFAATTVSAESRFQQIFYDIRMIWKQWIVIVVMILFHLVMIFGLKAPSCDRGYLGPGGIHDFFQHQNCTGGAIGYIDRSILGVNHMYQRARIRAVYDALVFDPEGVFGCLLTIVQVFLGVQCGVTLLVYPTAKDRLRRWIFWGLGLAALTAVLTFFTVDNGIIPINKNLWSLSFVSVTSSLAFLLLSLIYFLVDVRNIGDDFWTIFLYPGMNAIILYVGHSIFHKMWPFHFSFDVMNTHFILLLENCWTVTVWILISHYLYHKKIFYSI